MHLGASLVIFQTHSTHVALKLHPNMVYMRLKCFVYDLNINPSFYICRIASPAVTLAGTLAVPEGSPMVVICRATSLSQPPGAAGFIPWQYSWTISASGEDNLQSNEDIASISAARRGNNGDVLRCRAWENGSTAIGEAEATLTVWCTY